MRFCTLAVILLFHLTSEAAINRSDLNQLKKIAEELQKDRQDNSRRIQQQNNTQQNYLLRQQYRNNKKTTQKFNGAYTPVDQKPLFDLPVTYNSRVKAWIEFYQNQGRSWFKKRLERSYKYMPIMKEALKQKGLPQDLAYIAMIESGFSAHAVSHAKAVGYWQFISPTAKRYGLKIDWWVDERRDFLKSTHAAANYLGDLYKMFNSWYLTASAYNMGEGRLKRLIQKYKTRNYWELSEQGHFPEETKGYIPKLMAAMLISKAPKLYGFNNISPHQPMEYEYIYVPGGTDLYSMANYLNVERKYLRRLNPELLQGFVPGFVKNHRIRIPKGYNRKVAMYIREQM